jgi:Flp pilus assembly protein TadG
MSRNGGIRLMNHKLATINALLGRFHDNTRGVAVVEFALILPLLLLLYLGTVEASSLYTVDRRVTVISGTVGDLIARWDPGTGTGTVPQATINTYFSAANVIMTPYSTANLKQVVSFLYINTAGEATVLWSRATPGATPRATGSSYPLAATTQMNQIARGTTGGYLVVSETANSYKPVLGVVFPDALNLSHASYFLPRFGKCIKVMAGAASSACPL